MIKYQKETHQRKTGDCTLTQKHKKLELTIIITNSSKFRE